MINRAIAKMTDEMMKAKDPAIEEYLTGIDEARRAEEEQLGAGAALRQVMKALAETLPETA